MWLDPSAIRESGCILRLHNMLISGYRRGINGNDLEFGSAFHTYRKSYDTLTHDPKFKAKFETTDELTTFAQILAVKDGLNYWDKTDKYVKWNKKFLDRKYLENTFREYYNFYKTNGDEYEVVTIGSNPLVELRIPYPYLVTPEGDIEFILCGTVDRIVRHKSLGFYATEDYKTTSLWDKKKYFESYKLSTQMIAYKFMLKKYAELYPSSVIGQCASNLKCLINGVFVSPSAVTFERSEPLDYDDKKLLEFEVGLLRIIKRLIEVIRDPSKLYREGMLNGSCEKVYGACGYSDACGASNESERKLIMNEHYVKVPYAPLTHGELKVIEPL